MNIAPESLSGCMQNSQSRSKVPVDPVEANSGEALKDQFCKHYANIRLNCDASFQDRMQFDIYKRATKLERFEIFKEAQKKRLPKEEVDEAFARIQQDAKRRQVQARIPPPVVESSSSSGQNKRLSAKESEQMYDRFMDKWRQSQDVLEEKRRAKRLRQELEEKQLIESRKVKRRPQTDSSFDLVTRMNADVERRRVKQEMLLKNKQEEEQAATEGLFVPHTNKSRATGSQRRPKSRLNVSAISETHTLARAQSKPSIGHHQTRPCPAPIASKRRQIPRCYDFSMAAANKPRPVSSVAPSQDTDENITTENDSDATERLGPADMASAPFS